MENKNAEITNDMLCVGRVLIGVIGAQIKGEIYQFPENTDFSKIYKLSEKHRVTPLVAPSVIASANASNEIKTVFKKELFVLLQGIPLRKKKQKNFPNYS